MDEVGVAAGDCVAEPWGEAVPDFSSAPFFLEDLPESLALESCSCYKCQKSFSQTLNASNEIKDRVEFGVG